MIATIIGSTGLIGSLLLQQLLLDNDIRQVISIARRALPFTHAKLTDLRLTQLQEMSSLLPRTRADLYFCCLGSTRRAAGSRKNFAAIDHDGTLAFAALAKVHQARSFVLVSAMGASARSLFFYNRVKGQTENDVAALGLRSVSIFRPALLAGQRKQGRLLENMAGQTLVPLSYLLPETVQKKLVTPAEALAERMLAEGKSAPDGLRTFLAQQI